VFCANIYSQKELLPDGQLTLPYLYVLAAPDRPDTLPEMVPYPAGETLSSAAEPAVEVR
jgi:hypothetical protein